MESSKIPLDVEHLIFEMSAVSWWSTILPLMLTAHRVKAWVEPFLYHLIVLRGEFNRIYTFPSTLALSLYLSYPRTWAQVHSSKGLARWAGVVVW
ncbi:hypothetical protein B0H19DRAFT_1276828 [Mycena capillaripes]|nr:hypothetical protein B0H19DRAFT_1276828 [Mycena capillaripes]